MRVRMAADDVDDMDVLVRMAENHEDEDDADALLREFCPLDYGRKACASRRSTI